jgi:hypothetical protein
MSVAGKFLELGRVPTLAELAATALAAGSMYAVLRNLPPSMEPPFYPLGYVLVPLAMLMLALGVGTWMPHSLPAEPKAVRDPIVIDRFAGLYFAWLVGDCIAWPAYFAAFFVKIYVGLFLTGYPAMSLPAGWAGSPLAHTLLVVLLYALIRRMQLSGIIAANPPEASGRALVLNIVVAGLIAGSIYAAAAAFFGGHYLLTS